MSINKKRVLSILIVLSLIVCISSMPSFSYASGNSDDAVSEGGIDTKPIAPKAESLSLDATRLIFAKKGDALTLKATVKPASVDTSNIKFTSSDKKIVTVDKKGKVKAKGWGECKITVEIDGIKKTCRASVAKKWVALTFDDGPGGYTNKLLKTLRKEDVQATFFVLGSMAKSNNKALKTIYKDGHELANHTYNHKAGASTLMSQLKKTDKVIKKVSGKNTTLMRPPGGAINAKTKKCGKSIIMWSIDPKDWRDRNASTVRKRVVNNVRSGNIVLLHDIHSTTVKATPNIIKDLKKKGYTFVTVSTIIGKPKANKVYNKGRSQVKTMKIK